MCGHHPGGHYAWHRTLTQHGTAPHMLLVGANWLHLHFLPDLKSLKILLPIKRNNISRLVSRLHMEDARKTIRSYANREVPVNGASAPISDTITGTSFHTAGIPFELHVTSDYGTGPQTYLIHSCRPLRYATCL